MRNMTLKETAALALAFLKGNRLLRQAPRWSPEVRKAWQFRRIQELVGHAYRNVPFYHDLYSRHSFAPEDLRSWADFERLPVVTKDQVIANYPRDMLCRGLAADDLIVSRSSGSSGKVLDIAYDSQAFTTYILAGLRLYSMGFRYRPWHRQAYIYTSPYPLNSLFGLFPLHHLSTLTPIPEVIRELERLQPDLLVCYPSHLKQIARELESGQRRLRPKAVSVNSEMSSQKERDELAKQFGCPVLDEYSSEELTRVAAQCRHKRYHLFEDINYMETLDEAMNPTDQAGILVGTNLHNTAMPMIRYQQNDLGMIREAECACGWRFRELVNLQGRKNDSFQMPSGKTITSGFLLDATYDFLLEDRGAIVDFCLIQSAIDRVRLEIVPGQDWSPQVREKIQRRFEAFLEPGVAFSIETVGECTKTRTGKRNPIICLIGRTTPAEGSHEHL